MNRSLLISAAALAVALRAATAAGEVTRVTIAKRADIGMSGYEKIAGTLTFAVDPKNPKNAVIVDLDKAPRNAAGQVEFSADLYVIRPKDPSRGNDSALVEVSTRGDRTLLRQFNLANVNPDPEAEFELGDKFLMRFGFTLVWIGAPAGVPAGAGFAGLRDVAAWLKHQKNDVASVRFAYAYGKAVEGRFLRDFVARGFNVDERDRRAFDAVWMHAAGAVRQVDAGRTSVHEPNVFYTTTASDHFDDAGSAGGVTLPDNVRVYFLAGTQIEPSRFPPVLDAGARQGSPVECTWALRALLLALHRWVHDGKAPPPSAYPGPRRLVDEDGNERSGVLLPDVAAPLASYDGGGFAPFPATRAAREAAKDPRRSIEERYPSREAYLAQIEKLADALVLKGYLLIDDVPRIVQRSTDMWDVLTSARNGK